MTETVVHVETIEQWKSVLDVWFEQGYKWNTGETLYSERLFKTHEYLILSDYIYCDSIEPYIFIEYADFMAQQEKTMAKKTYYVTQEQLDLITDLKKFNWPLARLVNNEDVFRPLNNGLEMVEEKAILRYLGGDETIEFKVKEQLYRLWRIDSDNERVYMKFGISGTPTYTPNENSAFNAPLEEIKKWKTPSWEIEKAD